MTLVLLFIKEKFAQYSPSKMDQKKKNSDIKALVEEVEKLNGILSAAKQANFGNNHSVNVKFPRANSSRPSQFFPAHSAPGTSSVQFNRNYSYHKSAMIRQHNEHLFVNPKLSSSASQNNYSSSIQSYRFCSNSRFKKTNVNQTLPIQNVQKVNGLAPSKSSIVDTQFSVNRTSGKNVSKTANGKLPVSCLSAKDLGKSDSSTVEVFEKSREAKPSGSNVNVVQSVTDKCMTVDLEGKNVVNGCEIVSEVRGSSEGMHEAKSSLNVEDDIEIMFDSRNKHQAAREKEEECEQSNLKKEEDDVSEQSARVPQSEFNTVRKNVPQCVEISEKSTLQSNLIQKKSDIKIVAGKSLVSATQNSKQIWKSKYKVINRNVACSSSKRNSISSKSSQKSVTDNDNQVLKTKYKLVMKCVQNGNSVLSKTPKSVPRLKGVVSRKHSPILFDKRCTGVRKYDESLRYDTKSKTGGFSSSKCSSTRFRTMNGSSSSAKAFSKPQADSPKIINMKLNQLDMKTRSQYEGYDLSLISPQELVALDHKDLLKLVDAQKKPENYIKKSKYSYKLESRSSKSERWNRQTTKVSSMRRSPKQRSLQKSVSTPDSNRRHSRVATIRGVKYQIGSSGKCMKAVPKHILTNDLPKTPMKRSGSFGRTVISIETPPQARNIASQVLNRSIKIATKKASPKTDAYCIFFNRFGRCNHGERCPYIHDPKKIAVCKRFLNGTCKLKGCTFAHEENPGKMALCSFFLRGACNKGDSCPYRHEMLKPGAAVCSAFVKGYCSKGSECDKAHVLVCPDFAKGSCGKGESCFYPHPPKKAKRKIEDSFDNLKRKKEPTKKEEKEEDNDFRYFSHENAVTRKIINMQQNEDENNETCLPNGFMIHVLPEYIPLQCNTQYVTEKFDDAECLE